MNTEGISIDQVWVDEAFDESMITCFIDKNDVTNHKSDHQAIITIYSTTSGDKTLSKSQTSVKKNWNKVNSAYMKQDLTTSLPQLRPLVSREEIETFDEELRRSIINALNDNSPKKAPYGKHKAWWRPETLDPLRKEASRLRRLAKKECAKETRKAYKTARNVLNRTIDKAKEKSWRQFLSGVDHTNLFQAKRIASGQKASLLVSTIITDDGRTCSTNEEKAEAPFKATCVATAPCRLDSTNHLESPLNEAPCPSKITTPPFLSMITHKNIASVINNSPPKKAPSGNGIQNWVWKSGIRLNHT